MTTGLFPANQPENTTPQVETNSQASNTPNQKKTQKSRKPNKQGAGPRTEAQIHAAAHEAGADLSDREFRLFLVMANPEHYGKPRTEMADLAGITAGMAYEIPKREHFQVALRDFALSMLAVELPAIMSAHIMTAKIVGKEGYGDRKMLFDRLKVNPPSGKEDKLKEVNAVAAKVEAAALAAETNMAQIRRAGAIDVLVHDGGVQKSAQNRGLDLAAPGDPMLAGDDLQPIEHIGVVDQDDREEEGADLELAGPAGADDDEEDDEPDAPHPPHLDGPFPI